MAECGMPPSRKVHAECHLPERFMRNATFPKAGSFREGSCGMRDCVREYTGLRICVGGCGMKRLMVFVCVGLGVGQ